MQTFMPYWDFRKVAQCLDNKRLGKQRVEAWQIYQTLRNIRLRNGIISMINSKFQPIKGKKIAWENHPIVKMWERHREKLLYYGIAMCEEWISRGYKDTMLEKFEKALKKEGDHYWWLDYPEWIYDDELLKSHQSNLVRKFPEHYRKYFPNVPDDIPYKWVI